MKVVFLHHRRPFPWDPPGARLGLYSLSSVYKWEHLFYEKCNAILLLAWIKLMNVSGDMTALFTLLTQNRTSPPSASGGQGMENQPPADALANQGQTSVALGIRRRELPRVSRPHEEWWRCPSLPAKRTSWPCAKPREEGCCDALCTFNPLLCHPGKVTRWGPSSALLHSWAPNPKPHIMTLPFPFTATDSVCWV